MEMLPMALQAAGTVLSLVGASNQADEMRRAAVQNAENARIAAEANKRQLDYQAGQAEASAQHATEAKRRKAELLLSRAQAVAAASGGGPLDESLISGIIGEGEREAGFSMYEGNEQAAGARYRGDVGVYQANAQGRANIKAANRKANATLLGAFGSAAMNSGGLFSRFGNDKIGGTAYANRDFDTALDYWDYR